MFVHMGISSMILAVVLSAGLAFPVPAAATAPGGAADRIVITRAAGGDRSLQSEREARELLLNAKDALSSGNIRFLQQHLGKKIYLNLFTGINGYYSSEQAYLILESFFTTYTPISFSFSSRNFSIRNPYGFGPFTYERRGRRGTAEMFVSLATVDGRWVINQITVASR